LNKIEVAIILAILGVLVALLLPAVPKVRAAADKARCRNNLKQHGFAIHGYHDTHNHFPPGTVPNAHLPPDERLSFHVAVHPYTEASNLYKRLAKSEAWDSTTNVGVMAYYAGRLYQCPAWVAAQDQPPVTGHLAFTNYVGVVGVGADAATRPAEAPGIGIFGYDRAVKKDDVKDGLENTAMLFETARDLGPWIRGGPGTVRAVDVGDAPLAGADRPFGGTHFRRTWTFQRRTDGFNVLLADGSVRYTTNEINPAVLAALATIAGGEEIPPNW
jgi:hypothetical protein